ncbi:MULTISPECIES: hypothetical protein [unclassified Aeromonas]|uniref:hypothetical protein n=1 Tax=unclassified Aeromonas TaxID=257493 RepID=UPI0011B28EBB|nr:MULTISPECIES: hypothetical protein [unclassified Aeromonas]
MKKFGWSRWHGIYNSNQWKSLERWALYNLHHPSTLNDLAKCIVSNNIKNGLNTSVDVESIWIDGTPQAMAYVSGGTVKCELADLLYIVEEYDQNGTLLSEKGLLVQAKVTPKHNKLNADSSTMKERKLFEKINTSRSMTLYSGTSLNSSKIGSYVLGGANNLFDCSRFLLMPKKVNWQANKPYLRPFHVCWPKNINTSFMGHSLGLLDALQSMASGGRIGKSIGNPSNCQWSKMVRDLQNKYNSVQMVGYNQQYRIQCSSIINISTDNFGDILPSVEPNYVELNGDVGGPFISTVTVRIKQQLNERRE